MPTGQDENNVQYLLGELKQQASAAQRDLSRFSDDLKAFPGLVRSEFKKSMDEALAPLEKRIGEVEKTVSGLSDTISRWKAIFGFVIFVSGCIGAMLANVANIKMLFLGGH